LLKLGVVNVTKLGFGCQEQTNNWKKLRMTEPEEQTGHSSRELDRIVFFSDAVFAIAITLLVLNIEVPDIPQGRVAQELPGQLLALWPKYFSYVISFLVILGFWMSHHGIFSHVKDYDKGLMWMNSLFLMCVAFLPFPSDPARCGPSHAEDDPPPSLVYTARIPVVDRHLFL
jgi:uncharacterized membrane protein